MELIPLLTDREARKRELGADKATDWAGLYSKSDGRMLAVVLSIAAACETDHAALESQLNALLELGANGLTDSECLAHLREIDLTRLPENLREYVEDLLETA